MDTAMTAGVYPDPLTAMATLPHRAFAPPAPASNLHLPAASAPGPYWPAPAYAQAQAWPVPVGDPQGRLQSVALGLLLTVVLIGIPLLVYLASLS